jgi:hypothetical protein
MHQQRHVDIASLAKFLEPVSRCLTPEVARELVQLRADPAMQARLDELADKSTEGTLTAEEQIEYQTYVHAIDFIAILQTQAHRTSEVHHTSDHSPHT